MLVTDFVTASYQQDPVRRLYNRNYTTGITPTRYAPEAAITRGDFATLLYRFALVSHGTDHPFRDVTADYQQEAVAWASATGITTGVTPTRFEPNRSITRGEVATMLWRYVGSPNPPSVADVNCGSSSSSGSGSSGSSGSSGGSSGSGSSGSGSSGTSGRTAPAQVFVRPANLGNTVGAGADAPMPTATSGGWTVGQNGKVVENLIINGCMTVNADNVTFRNVIINCDNTYPVKVNDANNFRIEYSRIDCEGNGGKGIFLEGATNFTIDRIEVTNCDDQLFIDGGLGNSKITRSVFHNQVPSSAAHTDGIQLGEFDFTSGTLTIDRNWWQYNRNGCCENAVLFAASNSFITAVVTNNFLDGDFGTHIIRCYRETSCRVEKNFVSFEPDGFLVHDISPKSGTAGCNFYTNGTLVPNRLYDGITIDHSDC